MEWRVIDRFPGHEISEYGDVRRLRADRFGRGAGKLLKPTVNKGYNRFGLLDADGNPVWIYMHQLVALAFVGPPPFRGAEVCHKDGIRLNCHHSNLRWGTPTENAADRLAHGTATLGEKNGQSRLNVADVVAIRRLKSLGETQGSLSNAFNVSQSVISDIVNRKAWAHVS